MATEATDEQRRALTAELRRVARAIERTEARRKVLYARRLELFDELADAGVRQADIARISRVTRGAVGQQFHKGRARAEGNGT